MANRVNITNEQELDYKRKGHVIYEDEQGKYILESDWKDEFEVMPLNEEEVQILKPKRGGRRKKEGNE